MTSIIMAVAVLLALIAAICAAIALVSVLIEYGESITEWMNDTNENDYNNQ